MYDFQVSLIIERDANPIIYDVSDTYIKSIV
jgi:hypothetical protein